MPWAASSLKLFEDPRELGGGGILPIYLGMRYSRNIV